MNCVRLGSVGYLNARPLVFGLEPRPLDAVGVDAAPARLSARFELRFDRPSTCAELLHAGDIDVGLIPSIEYLRGPANAGSGDDTTKNGYLIVPDLAIVSRGPVASVALYATRPMAEVRSIAVDTSSRTSVALVRILCAQHFRIEPILDLCEPDLELMLARSDAALIIGDNALFTQPGELTVRRQQSAFALAASSGLQRLSTVDRRLSTSIEKVDLGEVWTAMTGLPFVWAFWAGRADALTPDDVEALQRARDAGVQASDVIARDYFKQSPERQRLAARYLRDNIQYRFGPDERAGLELFYRYAVDAGIVAASRPLRFF